jgi:hypothetical protein
MPRRALGPGRSSGWLDCHHRLPSCQPADKTHSAPAHFHGSYTAYYRNDI